MENNVPELLKLEIATICLVHLVAIIVSVACLTVFTMKTRRDDHAANSFVIMQLAMIMWMIFKVCKTVSPNVDLRWIFILAYYACTCVLEFAFVEFSYAYSKGKPIPGKIRKLLLILPILQFSWIATNPYHFLFYSYYDFYTDSFGPLFYVHMVLEYGFIITGYIFCAHRFKRDFSSKKRIVTYLVTLAIVVPLIVNFLFITGLLHLFTIFAKIPVLFDITPIVFTWSTLLFMYVTFKHDFITPTPLMRHEITHHLNLALALFNKNYRIVYCNEAFGHIIGKEEKLKSIIVKLQKHTADGGEVEFEYASGKRSLFIHCKKIHYILGKLHLVTLKDISQFKAIQTDITEKAKDIVIKNNVLERNIEQTKHLSHKSAHKYVARELHDIIGHSLVAAIKLLEVAKLYINKDGVKARVALTKASRIVDQGVTGMLAIPVTSSGEKNLLGGQELKNKIYDMAQTCQETGLKVTVDFKGVIYQIDEQLFRCLELIIKELMTNCLKHSKASLLFISLKISTDRILLLVVDDGIGTADTKGRGNGLTGIKERVSEFGGTIVIAPQSNEGFMVRITIPKNFFP